MYYLEDNVWKVMDFTLKDNLNRYSLKANYFKSCKFDKDIEKIGKLSGKLNDESVAKALNTEKLKDVELTISVTNNFQVVEFNVKAKTSYNRDATIVNTYTYDEEIVVLPYV